MHFFLTGLKSVRQWAHCQKAFGEIKSSRVCIVLQFFNEARDIISPFLALPKSG